jgi:hypothetical protein
LASAPVEDDQADRDADRQQQDHPPQLHQRGRSGAGLASGR